MKLFGSISELVSAEFRQNTQIIILQPNTGTYTGTTTISLPPKLSGSDILVAEGTTQTLTNKTLGNTNTATLKDSQFTLQDNGDTTKQAVFELSGITTGTTRTYTVPNASTTLVGTATAQTVSNKIFDNTNDYTAIDSGFKIESSGDTTKILALNVGAITTGTTRTWSIQDSSDTFVGRNTTDTLTNKTLDNTTVLSVKDSNFQIQDATVASKTIKFDSAGASSTSTTIRASQSTNIILDLPNAASDTIVARSSTDTLQNKFLDHTNSFNMYDSTIVISNLAQSSSMSFDLSALTAGNSPATWSFPNFNSGTFVGTATTQTLSNKTLASPNLTGFSDWAQTTTPSNPASGHDRLYFKSDDKLYTLTSAGVETAVGSGSSGAGEVNAVLNPSAVTDTTGWSAATNYTVARDTSNSPLNPIIPTSLSMTTTTASSESNSSGIAYSISTMPTGLQNKKLKVEFYVASPATSAGTWVLSAYNGTTRAALTTDSSGVTTIPGTFTGKFTAYFDCDNSASASIRFTQTSRTSSNTMYVTDLIVGPGIQPQGAVVGEPVAYTPTFNGFGTVTSSLFYKRVGTDMHIYGDFQVGTVAAATAYFTLPSGLTLDTAKNPQPTYYSYGLLFGLGASGTPIDTGQTFAAFYDGTNTDRLNVCPVLTAAGIYQTKNGNQCWNTNEHVSVPLLVIPISQWAGSGTVNVAQNDVEYASNSDTSNGSDTTSFAYGPSGSTLLTLSAAAASGTINKQVHFQTPIATSDSIILEINPSNDGITWFEIGQDNDYQGRSFQNTGGTTVSYGMAYDTVSATDINVRFGKGGFASTGSGYGTAGSSWAGGAKWRAKKIKSGQAVGFGIVQPGTSSGLVSASGLPGATNGATRPAGYVGEVITATLNGVSQASPVDGTFYDDTGTISLTAGIWLVFCGATLVGDGPGSITATHLPLLNLALRTGSTSVQAAYGGSGIVNGQNAWCFSAVTAAVNISSTTVYKQSVRFVSSTGSTSITTIETSQAYLFAVRIA